MISSLVAIIAAAVAAQGSGRSADLEEYAATVTGRFSSAGQASADKRYDVAEAEVVRIWRGRTDGVWLYQEQAILGGAGAPPGASKDKPYFQRIGHVYVTPDGSLRRDNYVLKEPARFVGLGRRRGLLEPRQEDLGAPGCHNVVERVGQGHFVSRTEGCPNRYKGAAMMKSIAISTPERLVNWDRGFDSTGKLVWGPEAGGYMFERVRR
jgi:hypothetical protein